MQFERPECLFDDKRFWMSVNISEWRKRFCWLKVWNFYLFCSDPFCAFFLHKKTAWVKELIILIFGKFSFTTVQMLYNKSRLFYPIDWTCGETATECVCACCTEWFAALLQTTFNSFGKAASGCAWFSGRRERWGFLLLNIFIQWDFTVRKISPINTNLAILGFKKIKKKKSFQSIQPLTWHLPFTWGKSSSSFQFWHILFCVVKNTLLCEKHFVELVNSVSGTKLKPQSSHAHFLQKLPLFSPHHSLGYCTFSDMIKTFTYTIFFFPVTLQFICLEAQLAVQWDSDAWSILELPRNALQPALSSILWQKASCCTPGVSFRGALDLPPCCTSSMNSHQVSWLHRFSSAAERNSWVRGVAKAKCEFPGLAGESLRDWVTAWPVRALCGVTVAPCPSWLGRAWLLGLYPSGDGDVGREMLSMCRSQSLRPRGGVTYKAQALERGRRRHQSSGLIKNTKKQPVFSPPNSSPLMFTVIKKHGWEM